MNPIRLDVGEFGEDVAELHCKLIKHGFDIPAAELERKFFGPATREAVRACQKKHSLPATGIVDKATKEALERAHATNLPTIGTVLPTLKLSTAADGRTTKPDILGFSPAVEYVEPAGLADPRIDQVRSEETVRTRVVKAIPSLSEYEQLIDKSKPIIKNTPLANLNMSDIESLAYDTAQDQQQIAWLTQAAQLATGTSLNPDQSNDILYRALRKHAGNGKNGKSASVSAEILYGLFQDGQPTSLEGLSAVPENELVAAVRRSIDSNIIPASMIDQIEPMKQFFKVSRAAFALKPATNGVASIGDVLRTIPASQQLTDIEQLEFAQLHEEYGSSGTLWEAVQDGELAPKRPVLERTFALQGLTKAHPPMMAALQERQDAANSASLDYLASVSHKGWLDLAFAQGTPPGSAMSPIEYAAQLERSIESQYPTAVLKERLQSGTIQMDNFPSGVVGNFLSEHRDFDLRKHDVDTYFDSVGIDSPEVRDGLKEMGRLFTLTSRIDAVAALHNEGLISRYKIAYAGYDLLHARLGDRLDDDTIRTIHQAASSSVDTSIAISSLMMTPKIGAGTSMFYSNEHATPHTSGATLRTLFGDMEFCECQHCQSVLGPAAYLADLLHFMETSPADLGGSVLDALAARRPDLLDLELSCENTNTEIPYVDLVLEVLENAVAFDPPLEIALPDGGTPGVEDELNEGRVPLVVQTELRKTAMIVGDSFTVTPGPMPLAFTGPSGKWIIYPSEHSQRWIISDHSRRWQVTYEPRGLLWRPERRGRQWDELLPSSDALSDIEAGLQAGSLHPELMKHLAPYPFPPVKGNPRVTPLQRSLSGAPRWEISIRQEVEVEVRDGTPSGMVIIYAEGQTPREISFPRSQLQAIGTWLAYGAILDTNPDVREIFESYRDAALTSLGLPQTQTYEVSIDPVSSRYLIQVHTNGVLTIAPGVLTVDALTYQNSSIHADLAAMAENRNPAAYRKLREAVFPWTLPFDLWTEEIRAFLTELGVSRRKLIEITSPSKLDSDLYTAETLGVSASELKHITDFAGPEPWKAWGFGDSNWLQEVKNVSTVIQQARLSYRELLEVLQTSRGGVIMPEIEPKGECHPSKMYFSAPDPLDPALFDWIHRFTRLQRLLGWSARELDGALTVFENRIEPKSLRGLALIRRLNERLHTTTLSVCTMLGNLETRPWTRYTEEGSPVDLSLYERLFQPPPLHKSASNDFFRLNSAGKLNYLDKNPPRAGELLSRHDEFVASCLGIKTLELKLLIAAASEVGISNEVRLENLGILYGIVQFARALGLKVEEFLRWQKVLDCYPFKGASLDHTLTSAQRTDVRCSRAQALLDFAEAVDFAKHNGQSLENLEYLLRHEATPESSTKMKTRYLESLTNIRSALRTGQVLGDAGYENLLLQLERAGVPSSLIAGLRSDEAMGEVLKAEITISRIPVPEPVIPEALRRQFYFTANSNRPSARFGCRGIVTDEDFDALGNVGTGQASVPAAFRADLKSRYKLIQEILLSQLQYHPIPIFKYDFATPAPTQEIPDDFSGFLSYNKLENQLQLIGMITAAQRDSLKAALPHFSTQIEVLFEQSKKYVEQNNRTLLEPGLARDLLMTSRSDELILRSLRSLAPILEPDLLAAQVASFTGLDQSMSAELLKSVQVNVAGTVRNAEDVLFDKLMLESDLADAIDEPLFSVQLEALTRLDKVALLLLNSGITVKQLEWLTKDIFEVIIINSIPAAAGQPAARFVDWRAWAELLLFARSIPDGPLTVESLVEVLKTKAASTASRAKADAVLEGAYKLPEKYVRQAYTDLLAMTWPVDFRKPRRLLELAALLNLLQKLGTSPAVIKQLIKTEPDEQDAIAARALFVAQFDVDTAPKRLEPVSNRLRPRQRDALVDYLRTAYALTDANDLLDYFLIDVQMEACMRTSRVKQAISSAQLFIQRCLLNLEREYVLPSDINSRRWEWMKNYRVWEANRKVFLYPENWIEPDLRDDKTEIFKQLESDLLQEDLKHETALTAFRQYLESAADIARPVIISMWYETLETGNKTNTQYRVHIVARDRATPHKFFYRSVTSTIRPHDLRTTLAWHPWELIEGDFPSSHILVCAVEGSPYVISPSIQLDDEGKWKIHPQIRKRGPDGWKSQKQSIDFVTHGVVPGKDIAQSFVFVPVPTAHSIRIDCFGGQITPAQDVGPVNFSPQVDIVRNFAITKDHPDGVNDVGDRTLDYSEFRNKGTFFYTQIADKLLFRVIRTYKSNDVALNAPPTDQPLTLTATIECDWYASSDLGGEDILTNFTKGLGANARHDEVIRDANDDRLKVNGVPPSVGGALPVLTVQRPFPNGVCKQDNPVVLFDYFQVAATIRGLNLPWWLKCVPKRVTSIKLSTRVDTTDYTKPFYESKPIVLEDSATGKIFGTGSISMDLQIFFNEGKMPTSADSSRDLTFSCFGSFEFDEARALFQSVPPGDAALAPIPASYEYYSSGYRSLPAAPLTLNGKTVLTTGDPSRFFFAPTRGYSTDLDLAGAYSDSRLILYFLHAGDKIRAVPEGQYWLWNGLRTLDSQREGQIDLEVLPQSLSGSNAPLIPFGENTSRIDLQKSPKSIDVAFDQQLPASVYDWEVFFHIPLLIATQLSQGQRFEEARRWFHTIFDPTSNSEEDETIRYWRFPPFKRDLTAAKDTQAIDDFLEAYARGTLPKEEKDELEDNIEAWKDNPFNPHLIARFRKRGYMWAVVIKYIQNLIAWGDQLFRRDTIESINEATQLYILAARILGARPASNPKSKTSPLSYRDLAGQLDSLSNKWIEYETLVASNSYNEFLMSTESTGSVEASSLDRVTSYSGSNNLEVPVEILRSIGALYFSIPHNENILKLWDAVEDRLFNIRNCRNIDGVERPLPLFEPPIDPALLVRAVAAGLDLASVLNDLSAPLPLHRFPFMLQKALELSGDLRALGGAVLSALEKKDAEELALLRSSHEMTLLHLTEQVRGQQIQEARTSIEGLHESRKTAEERYQHYQHLLAISDIKTPQLGDRVSLASVPTTLAKSGLDAKEQGLGISQTEQDQLHRLAEAQGLTLTAGILNGSAAVQFGASSYFATSFLQGAGHALNAVASALNTAASYAGAFAGRDAIVGGYERRRDEWIFQSNMALRELAQIDKQIAAAEIREAIATQELENTRQQITNSQEVDDYLRSKYSSKELYRFMSNQLLSLYFRTYQLAFELAKRAERCYKFELGLADASFVKTGYWDSVRKGLLAGEQLQLDLRRMEISYLEQNKREYEITKHVSVLQLDPIALLTLRQTGKCEVSIPEALFDFDFPGHYLRRIKTVSLTIPCVSGPYSAVPCTLTLLKSELRKSNSTSGGYARTNSNESSFTDMFGPIQSIVTSSGQNDSGLFETNLRDERYLPFEGAGAVSTWRIELPNDLRQFDYDTISDVILHIRYTARGGGEKLRKGATDHLNALIDSAQAAGSVRLFSIRHEFPTDWAKFKSGMDSATKTAALTLCLRKDHYPFWSKNRVGKVTELALFAKPHDETDPSKKTKDTITVYDKPKDEPNAPRQKDTLKRDSSLNGILQGSLTNMPKPIGEFALHFDDNTVEDLWLVLTWSSGT